VTKSLKSGGPTHVVKVLQIRVDRTFAERGGNLLAVVTFTKDHFVLLDKIEIAFTWKSDKYVLNVF